MKTLISRFALYLFATHVLLMGTVLAATPSEGTISNTSGPIQFESGPFTLSNPTPLPQVDNGPECFDPVQPCDDFILTVDLPEGYANAHPNDYIRFSFTWADAAAGVSDYDFYIFDGIVGDTSGAEEAHADAATGDQPETTFLGVCQIQTEQLTVKVVPYTSTGEIVQATIEYVEGPAPEPGDACTSSPFFGVATPTAPGLPRYQNFYAPDGTAAQGSSGEANIGFNPFSGNIMLMNSAPVFRLTPPELLDPPLPEAGPAQWDNVSPIVASIETLDPIMVTDQTTGRTFISNQTTGPNVLFAITDDDGELWIEASAAPPTGGVDHQTIGVGPYPPPLAGLNAAYPNAVYYCTQALSPDFCQRSDTGGLTWEPGVPINNEITTTCGGLHGHVKVAPNGVVYVPDKSCGAVQGGSASEDAGVTWREFLVPDSLPSGSDPSIGIATDNTLYFCHTNEHGAWVAVSRDNGETWEPSVNIGESVGVKNAVFPQAVAGDPDRAACGFLGTDVAGNSEGLDFGGVWYLFIAHTYDGGETWTTVNATPNDPVQGAGGICTGGLGCGSNRNLLDFNEVTMDDRGRVLFGYDDGCVSDICQQSRGAQNDFVAYWRVARQYGGNPLLSAFDPQEPTLPGAPYLDGKRNQFGPTLNWRAPNDSGSEITEYRVLRGEASGNLNQVATVLGSKTSYADASADPDVEIYYYQVVAVNGEGAGSASNEIALEVVFDEVQNLCLAPGLTTLTDASGDSLTGSPGSDVRSFHLAQPFAEDGNIALRFQINTDPGLSAQPPESYWYVSFKTPDDVVHGVRMLFDSASPLAPEFQSYLAGANSVGGVDGRFVVDGSEVPATGTYDAQNGVIVINVPIADLGVNPGDTITAFNAASVQAAESPTGGGAAATVDEMPNGLGRQGAHTLKTNAECGALLNQPPVAVLMADPREGTAPLDVNFDASASFDSDEGDSIVSYTFDFNDGSDPVTQADPMISHTYTSASTYRATLTVTDSQGLNSGNAAEVVIRVEEPQIVTQVDDSDPAVEYRKGWHYREDAAASNGGYHRRMGSPGGGETPTARLEFEGSEITYFYGTSEQGGSADVFLDGVFRATVDYSGSAKGNAPDFGHSITIDQLGEGSHEFLLQFRTGAAYVDGFEIVSGASGGPDESAAETHSETSTSSGTLSLLGNKELTHSVTIGPDDEWLSVVVDGAPRLLTVNLLDALGNLTAAGDQLLSGTNAVGLDIPMPAQGTYTVQVLGATLQKTDVEISVSRTITVD